MSEIKVENPAKSAGREALERYAERAAFVATMTTAELLTAALGAQHSSGVSRESFLALAGEAYDTANAMLGQYRAAAMARMMPPDPVNQNAAPPAP